MILDSVEKLFQYKTILPGIGKVVEFLKGFDINQFPEKKIELDGDKLFVIPSVCQGKIVEDAFLEAHNVYADIQVCLGEEETFGWRSRSACSKPKSDFDTSKDIVFFDDKPTAFVRLTANEFVIFLPEDAHAPLICDGEVVKLIFKVKVE